MTKLRYMQKIFSMLTVISAKDLEAILKEHLVLTTFQNC